MRETKTTNFRIEDAITEAYEQMNEKFGYKYESHCGTDRKENKEVNEQLSAKFSKDFDKEAKQKGPHQDSSVYKQMRDIIKSRGIGTVKTDKGSMKVDVQSAYRWLASYHMLTDKNKKNLIKMAQRGANSLATTIKVAQTLTVKR